MQRIFYIALFCFVLVGGPMSIAWAEGNVPPAWQLQTPKKTFVAGQNIALEFTPNGEQAPILFVQTAYGSTLLKAENTTQNCRFAFPAWCSKKAGLVKWRLLFKQQEVLSGDFHILPDTATRPRMESYFGPRQILAGNTDYTMLVVIPTDPMDNPYPSNSTVTIREQFYGQKDSTRVKTQHLMAWKNIYSRSQTGKILVSANCHNSSTQELTSLVFPFTATDFNISSHAMHLYADGNQLLELRTSSITDAFGNVISDGTMVEFIITNSGGYRLKTFGETLNGVAVAKILHPEFPDRWKVKAYIAGLAKSNALELDFTSVLDEIPVTLSQGNRHITVGPLTSFMHQLVPDGVRVKLTLTHATSEVEELEEYTRDGIATFELKPGFYAPGAYNLRIETLGKTQEIIDVNLNETSE